MLHIKCEQVHYLFIRSSKYAYEEHITLYDVYVLYYIAKANVTYEDHATYFIIKKIYPKRNIFIHVPIYFFISAGFQNKMNYL